MKDRREILEAASSFSLPPSIVEKDYVPVLQIRSRHMPVLEAGESPLHPFGSIIRANEL